MAVLIPRPPLDFLPLDARPLMDHSQAHVIVFELAIDCGTGDVMSVIEKKNAAYHEWKKLHPEFDDSCPF